MADRKAEQSQRDDMESLGYLFLYFLRGRLPWQGMEVDGNEDKNMLVMTRKKNISAAELCDQAPKEFAAYFEYVRALDFHDKPDYSSLRSMFRKLFARSGFAYDNVFDWTWKRYVEQLGPSNSPAEAR